MLTLRLDDSGAALALAWAAKPSVEWDLLIEPVHCRSSSLWTGGGARSRGGAERQQPQNRVAMLFEWSRWGVCMVGLAPVRLISQACSRWLRVLAFVLLSQSAVPSPVRCLSRIPGRLKTLQGTIGRASVSQRRSRQRCARRRSRGSLCRLKESRPRERALVADVSGELLAIVEQYSAATPR